MKSSQGEQKNTSEVFLICSRFDGSGRGDQWKRRRRKCESKVCGVGEREAKGKADPRYGREGNAGATGPESPVGQRAAQGSTNASH